MILVQQYDNADVIINFPYCKLKEKFTPEWPFIFFTPIKSLYKNMLFTKISASNER